MKPAFMVGFFSSYGPLVCFLEDHVVSGGYLRKVVDGAILTNGLQEPY